MQVHPISNIDSNNCFKAKFVNDKNGFFTELWNSTLKTRSLSSIIDEFSSKNKDQTIEIINVERINQYNPVNKLYTLFNHTTGNTCKVTNDDSSVRSFGNVLRNLLKEKDFFDKNSDSAKMYQKITKI